MKKLLLLCSTAAAFLPTAAFAQSTGTAATENEEAEAIVITGTRSRGVGGVVVPDVPKTRSILTNEVLLRQSEGQSVLQSINLIPGVNFTNTDPYGSSGGNLRIRGFPGNRVALLFDGLPLNDTGNYAIFSNQQLDQEIIDQVSVNLGTTDVDSPTPSAAGGVVSYRTIVPTTDIGAQVKGSIGDFDYRRFFGIVQSGELTSFGTRAFISASDQKYDKFKGLGDLEKRQYNARIYQPIGSNGDFVSIAGHFNRNRNNSYNNGLVSDYVANRYFDNIDVCVRDAPTAGVRDDDNSGSSTNNLTPASCTNYYNLRINPSDTGNVRGAVRLSLTDNLILTADPGYQTVVANGGGTTTINENDSRLRGTTNASSTGVDLNGDGDTRDNVRVYQPSNTRTKRYTFLSSLIWEVNDTNRLRVAYTFDRGRHRQTGEFGRVDSAGNPLSVFGGKYSEAARIVGANGATLQNRDRLSIALLNQFSAEYFGRFLDNRLTVTAGVRAPFFKRELNQYCYTANGATGLAFGGVANADGGGASVTAGNPYCTSQANPVLPGATAANPLAGAGTLYFLPFERTVKYSPILPSGGVSYDFASNQSVYASYGRNFSSPSTDNLYRSVVLDPLPEYTNSFEAGYRFRSGRVQAQLATYYVNYKNRIVSATDLDPDSPTFGSSTDRNVGDARAYGFDGQISFRPFTGLSIYSYLSYINSKLKDDVLGRAVAGNATCIPGTTSGGFCQTIAVNTKGARFVETPTWTAGGRVQKEVGPLSFGVQAKWVGRRYSTDDNGRTGVIATGNLVPVTSRVPVDARGRALGYAVFDADVRLDLDKLLPLKGSSLRVSVINLTDEYYFGNINTANTLGTGGAVRYSVGAPRTFQATLGLGF